MCSLSKELSVQVYIEPVATFVESVADSLEQRSFFTGPEVHPQRFWGSAVVNCHMLFNCCYEYVATSSLQTSHCIENKLCCCFFYAAIMIVGVAISYSQGVVAVLLPYFSGSLRDGWAHRVSPATPFKQITAVTAQSKTGSALTDISTVRAVAGAGFVTVCNIVLAGISTVFTLVIHNSGCDELYDHPASRLNTHSGSVVSTCYTARRCVGCSRAHQVNWRM